MITEKRKTSTITIITTECRHRQVTIAEWRTLAAFVKDAGAEAAALFPRHRTCAS